MAIDMLNKIPTSYFATIVCYSNMVFNMTPFKFRGLMQLCTLRSLRTTLVRWQILKKIKYDQQLKLK